MNEIINEVSHPFPGMLNKGLVSYLDDKFRFSSSDGEQPRSDAAAPSSQGCLTKKVSAPAPLGSKWSQQPSSSPGALEFPRESRELFIPHWSQAQPLHGAGRTLGSLDHLPVEGWRAPNLHSLLPSQGDSPLEKTLLFREGFVPRSQSPEPRAPRCFIESAQSRK